MCSILLDTLMIICNSCKKEIEYGSIDFEEEGNSQTLCPDCYNQRMADRWGIEKPNTNFEPITVKDVDGLSHTFIIHSMLTSGLGMEAIEVKDGQVKDYGYKFSVVVHPETDGMEAFKLLYEKIKTGLKQKYIVKDGFNESINT